ncbi:MAG: hypothetical protein ACKVZ0_03900 [Gemmatimonadales bacterium]
MTADATLAADTHSVDAIIRALYAVISGPAGPRDWVRDRNLFHPKARLMRGMPAGSPELQVFSIDEFRAFCEPRFDTEAFYEWEIGREEFRFGRWVHVVSAYESRHAVDQLPYARGINSIQLWFEDDRWWIVNLIWDWERPDLPIPAHLDGPPRI